MSGIRIVCNRRSVALVEAAARVSTRDSMTDLLFPVVLSIVVIVVLYNSIRIAGESERFAVFILGRFQAFKGPGLVLITPYTQQVHPPKVGDIGVLSSSEFARFGAVDRPVTNVESLR